MQFNTSLKQVPSLFKSKTNVSDNCSITLQSGSVTTSKNAWMFEGDYLSGHGPVFESERAAKECATDEDRVVQVTLTIV